MKLTLGSIRLWKKFSDCWWKASNTNHMIPSLPNRGFFWACADSSWSRAPALGPWVQGGPLRAPWVLVPLTPLLPLDWDVQEVDWGLVCFIFCLLPLLTAPVFTSQPLYPWWCGGWPMSPEVEAISCRAAIRPPQFLDDGPVGTLIGVWSPHTGQGGLLWERSSEGNLGNVDEVCSRGIAWPK